MATETSPLIHNEELEGAIHDHEAVYNRFSVHEKHIIVALVSWSGTSLPISQELRLSRSQMRLCVPSLAVSLSIFFTALGALIYAPYSIYYGRRIAYLTGSPLSRVNWIPELLVARCIQALGTSGGTAIGASVIGDIYKLTERGRAMGIFFGATLVGPALSPLAGGWGAHYASWRWTQFCLGVAGLLTFLLLFTFLPETSHPESRGIDKYRAKLGDSNGFKWVWLNPFASIAILRSPNILLVTIAGTFTLVTDFFLLMPIAYTIGVRYNITNELIIGACFIPTGLERLKAALFGALVPVPLSILLSGLITQYIPGPLGLTLNLMCFVMNGLGVDLVLTPLCAYVVDIMRERSANSFRSMLLAAALTLAIPSIKLIGVAATDAIVAVVAWLTFGLILLTLDDVGYTKVEDA
ncbi:major facilitator superfamily domain-containing protein [Mucidula mucida]|nr:major facilitator superfamily domain-containing protein [Mucidula mucida]